MTSIRSTGGTRTDAVQLSATAQSGSEKKAASEAEAVLPEQGTRQKRHHQSAMSRDLVRKASGSSSHPVPPVPPASPESNPLGGALAMMNGAVSKAAATTTAWVAPGILTRAGIRTGPRNPDPASFPDMMRKAMDTSAKVAVGHAIGTTVIAPAIQSAASHVIAPEDLKTAFPDPVRGKKESRSEFRARQIKVDEQRGRMAAKQNALNAPDNLPNAAINSAAFAAAEFVSRQGIAPGIPARPALMLGLGAALASLANSSIKLATTVDGRPAFRPVRPPDPAGPMKSITAAAKQIMAPPSQQFARTDGPDQLENMRNRAANIGKVAVNIGSNLGHRATVHTALVGMLGTVATVDARAKKTRENTPDAPSRVPGKTRQSAQGAATKGGVLGASAFFNLIPKTTRTDVPPLADHVPFSRTADVIRDGTSSFRGKGPRDLHALLTGSDGLHPVAEKLATAAEAVGQIATLPSKVVVQAAMDTPFALSSVALKGGETIIGVANQLGQAIQQAKK